jgi:hypothetical protein
LEEMLLAKDHDNKKHKKQIEELEHRLSIKEKIIMSLESQLKASKND